MQQLPACLKIWDRKGGSAISNLRGRRPVFTIRTYMAYMWHTVAAHTANQEAYFATPFFTQACLQHPYVEAGWCNFCLVVPSNASVLQSLCARMVIHQSLLVLKDVEGGLELWRQWIKTLDAIWIGDVNSRAGFWNPTQMFGTFGISGKINAYIILIYHIFLLVNQ
jgi:hypothetical protein